MGGETLTNKGVIGPGQTLKFELTLAWYNVRDIYMPPGGDKIGIKLFTTLPYTLSSLRLESVRLMNFCCGTAISTTDTPGCVRGQGNHIYHAEYSVLMGVCHNYEYL